MGSLGKSVLEARGGWQGSLPLQNDRVGKMSAQIVMQAGFMKGHTERRGRRKEEMSAWDQGRPWRGGIEGAQRQGRIMYKRWG